jgi:hypothetical protein
MFIISLLVAILHGPDTQDDSMAFTIVHRGLFLDQNDHIERIIQEN